MSLEQLFSEAGMSLLYLSSNDSPWWPIYLFAVGARHPDRWKELLPAAPARAGRIGVHVLSDDGMSRAAPSGQAPDEADALQAAGSSRRK
jgi:hypothetical protein